VTLGFVLALFPGIGLLDEAFEKEGATIVRGPDLIFGGDIRGFTPPAGKFDGIIGGPPCQRHGNLGKVNIARWGDDSVLPDMIPDFVRCVEAARPSWFVMENVPGAPLPQPAGYTVVNRICDNRWVGGEQRRRRRFSFGHLSARIPPRFHIEGVALEAIDEIDTVVSTGQTGSRPRGQLARKSIDDMAIAQGIDPRRFDNSPFSITELRRAIANGVPLPMGRAVARAVKAALSQERVA
jgi:DNA (cytosine-5)-methyltransferase 1